MEFREALAETVVQVTEKDASTRTELPSTWNELSNLQKKIQKLE